MSIHKKCVVCGDMFECTGKGWKKNWCNAFYCYCLKCRYSLGWEKRIYDQSWVKEFIDIETAKRCFGFYNKLNERILIEVL